jgi:uncharacterized membrane protein YukC
MIVGQALFSGFNTGFVMDTQYFAGLLQVSQQLEDEKRSAGGMTSELQSVRQQLAALRAENGALKQQKSQSSQKEKKATEDKLAAAEVSIIFFGTS